MFARVATRFLLATLIALGGCARSRQCCCNQSGASASQNVSARTDAAIRQSNAAASGPGPAAADATALASESLVQQTAYQEAAEPPTTGDPSGLRPARPEALPPPMSITAEELTLDQIVALCLANDPRLRAGFEAIVQANAGAVTASLHPNPLFFTDGQLLQLAKDFTPTRQGGPPQQDFQLGYPIDWFLFGKRAAAMASASQAIRVSQSEYENLIRERVTKASLAFYDVSEADRLLGISRQDVETLQRIVATTQKAVDAGGKPQVDLNRLRLALIISQRTLREAGAASATARSRLNALVGGALTNRSFSANAPFDAPIRLELPPTEAAYNAALQNRPDLIALRWKLEQARSDMLVEEKKAYPVVTMTFGYTRQYQLHTIGFPDADSWSAALAMPLPIWDKNQGNIMAAQSVATQSRFELDAGELELWSEVESVLAELAAARDNARAVSEQELQLAQQVLESINQSYAIGGRTLLDLLDAQRSYRDTYRAFTASRANYWRAHARYQSAIGQQYLP
jgi:cobalt-zinc-cadmium efflux system outer membrane protein